MGVEGEGPNCDQSRPASMLIDAEAVARAANGFHQAFPRRSAKRVLHVTQLITLGLIGYGLWQAHAFDAALTVRIL